MTVYALIGFIPYECTALLGIYHTEEEAEQAYATFKLTDDAFNEYKIRPVLVGSPANWEDDE